MEQKPDIEKFEVKEKFANSYKAILGERCDEFIIPTNTYPLRHNSIK
jgi:hypothetical protein